MTPIELALIYALPICAFIVGSTVIAVVRLRTEGVYQTMKQEDSAVWYRCNNCSFEMYVPERDVQDGLCCPNCRQEDIRTRLWGTLELH